MRRTALAALLFSGCASSAPPPEPTAEPAAEPPTPVVEAKAATLPKTAAHPVSETLHGVEVQDPFRWLEDVSAPDVKAWMAARDANARTALAELPEHEALQARFRELLYVETRSAPEKAGGRLFYSVKPADKEKAIYYWQQGESGEPQVLLDPNTMTEDGSLSIHDVVPTEDGRKVAYMEQANNADESTLRVMEVDTKAVLAGDSIEHLRYTSPSWTPKGDGFYYTWIPSDPAIAPPDRMAHAEVRFHQLGTDPKTDRTVRGEIGDASTWQGAALSKDGRFLVLTQARGWSEQDVYVMEPGAKKPEWKPLAVGTKSNYMVVPHGGALYVASNHEAPRWRIFRVDPKRMARKDWKLIVPEHPSAVLESMQVVGGKLGLAYLDNATNRLEVRGLDGKLVRQVPLPTLGTTSGFFGDPKDDVAYFRF
ncbi:MAG: S9 family peptidase, partial [Myxococcales bacterium]|nr:S9 family peptidase [Myxococcales bacterium]